uniref:Uncharacterized protein n=1 Tax=Anguilla anguilla TaxID=7936 RepID=A0A0E9U6W5_ANGAN
MLNRRKKSAHTISSLDRPLKLKKNNNTDEPNTSQ